MDEDKWYYEAIVESRNGHIYTRDLESGEETWKMLKDFDVDM